MSDNEESIISEPTISYSYTSSNNFSSGSLKKVKTISHNLTFTPLWKSDIKEYDSEKEENHKYRKSAFFTHRNENYNSTFFRVSTAGDLRRITPDYPQTKLVSKKESENNINYNKNNNKNSDFTEKYDELIEKLKRSPPQVKTNLYDDNCIDTFYLNTEDNNINKNNSFRQRNTKDDFLISQKRFSSPLIFKNSKEDRRCSVQYNLLMFTEEKVKNFTNTEVISDFYEYTERCMEMILDLDQSKQEKIKEKINLHFPKEEKDKKIALFDLDETLAHCVGEIKENDINIKPYKHIVNVTLPSRKKTKIGINIRPNWKETMDFIKEKYQIVIYTASHQSYADAVLNYMDPKKKYTKYRLYRNNCVQANVNGKKFYIKDLSIFDKYYNLKDIVIVDNSVLSFAYHLNNGIPIVPYYDSEEDSELQILGFYLLSIYDYDDLREANKIHIRISYYLEKARKDREEEEEEEEEEEDSEFDEIDVISENEEESNQGNYDNIPDDNTNNTSVKNNNDDKNEGIVKKYESKKNHNKKKFDRSQTININLIKNKNNNLQLSPEKPRRKNSGLNIINIWKGIRRQMTILG